MAPGGSRAASTPSGPRNPRGSGGSKLTRTGGIQKRRAPTTKVDRDGDLDMDATAGPKGSARKNNNAQPNSNSRTTRSSTASTRAPKPSTKVHQTVMRALGGTGSLASRVSAAGNGSGKPTRNTTRPINSANTMTLRVLGLKNSKAASNDDGGLSGLLSFLERKAAGISKDNNRTVRIKKSQMKGDYVFITASREDADEVLKVNGFAFAGTTLEITEASGGIPDGPVESSSTQEIKSKLQEVLSLRYDPVRKLLNLSSLGEDPTLNSLGAFSGQTTPEKVFLSLMAICDGLFKTAKDKREAVSSVSLAGNSVDDVSQVKSLADTFPDLINLDLSHNQFRDTKGIEKWRHRFRNLETLLLNGNPIEAANPNYKTEIMTWYPKLLNLSDTQVRTPEQVAAAAVSSRPTPIPQKGADFRDINRIGEGFVTEFLQMYDSDRGTLAAKYYDSESTFSLAVNTQAPHPEGTQRGWQSYIKFSRNHLKITHSTSRLQRLFTGANVIQSAWQGLPPTKHPDITTDFNKYIIDCHSMSGLVDLTGQNPQGVDGMIITMHGEFDEQDRDGSIAKRSFSRTFVLGPGHPGGNPIRVISDMLSLKAYNPLIAVATPAPTQPHTTATVLPDQRQQIVVELCRRTNMTPQYAELCLEVANWNFDQALVTFNEKRAELPPEAFASSTV